MHHLASLTTRDLESVTGGASPSEALAGAYTASGDMTQPETLGGLARLGGHLAAAVSAGMSGSLLTAAKEVTHGLADASFGQIKDAFNGKGAPIVAPGL